MGLKNKNVGQKETKTLKHGTILGVKISSTPKSELLKTVFNYVKEKHKFFIVTPNPEIITLAQRDQNLLEVLNTADISLPDATGVVFASYASGSPQIERIPGRIFMTELFALANENKYKVYLLGSTDSVIKKCLEKMKTEFPNVLVEGSEGPMLDKSANPINSQEDLIDKEIIKKINDYKPAILFIAFGAPKQEKWWSLHSEELNIGGAMVVGGSFDYYSDHKKVPPALLSKLGLEWSWRLVMEPRRIGRIFNAVIVFPLLFLRSFYTKKNTLK